MIALRQLNNDMLNLIHYAISNIMELLSEREWHFYTSIFF
jgi:hypothetical protein